MGKKGRRKEGMRKGKRKERKRGWWEGWVPIIGGRRKDILVFSMCC